MMLKNKENRSTSKSNGDSNSQIKELLNTLISQNKELVERIEELESKKANINSEAMLRLVNFLFDTDEKHLPELTRISSMQSVRLHAYGMMLEARFDPDVQNGTVPLSRKLREYLFRLSRSFGGIHLGTGIQLAQNQAAAEAEKVEEYNMGEGAG